MNLANEEGRKRRRALLKDKEIESVLERDRVNQRKTVKVLALGGAGSGKSTVVQQTNLAYGGVYTKQQLSSFEQYIFRYTIEGMRMILTDMGQPFPDIKKDNRLNPISTLPTAERGHRPSHKIGSAISLLWNDPEVRQEFEVGRCSGRLEPYWNAD
ncbi:guanine nucleotide-binding protein subunit alpha [Trapelia coarctata]|nr:guanine nucleotide-binding protein subunit alpha [Trapelia coarctata]